ncbi:MAG: spore germination protein [Firmicutes bacterium]|nr:spore germination protein [Bacillota bacterium]
MKGFLNRLTRKGKEANKTVSLSRSLEQNLTLLKENIFQNDQTIVYRRFRTRGPQVLNCALIFVDQMIDKEELSRNVIRPLMRLSVERRFFRPDLLKEIIEQVISISELELQDNMSKILNGILHGETLLLIDGLASGILINARKWTVRSIVEPASESVVRGPREGFTETLMTNLSMVRRKISSEKLRFEFMKLGTQTKTDVAIGYIDGIAPPNILAEVKKRLNEIKVEAILESGYIEELIKDSPLTPFKTVGHTERPDVVAAKLLEGRIAIFCDGTPFVLTIPFLFLEAFQANEDYYKNYFLASLDRLIRYISFIITTTTPAIYLSLVTYHQELIPTPLLLSLSASREGVPLPTVVEVIAMGFVFEILREGGVRLPNPIGSAVSIVGAIVLGDAAASAGLVSSPMIIVVALTAIASFAVPKLLGLATLIRLYLVLFSAFLGLYGFFFGIIGLFIQLCSMRSFGVPYLSNFATLQPHELQDTVIRAPWWVMSSRSRKTAGKKGLG